MDIIRQYWSSGSTSECLLAFALVAAVGLAFAHLKFRKLGLGVAGVLFAGLILGHAGVSAEPHVLDFIRDFGLILFVFSIGLQLGPGFFSSLRKTGLKLNMLAAFNVLMGVLMCVVILYLSGVDIAVAAGLLSGATTNTPSLAAAQQALSAVGAQEGATRLQGTAYALAYPFGVIGVIAAMLIARRFIPREKKPMGKDAVASDEPVVKVCNLAVRNPGLAGRKVGSILASCKGIAISRMSHDGKTSVPVADTVVGLGDILLVVGQDEALDNARMLIGADSDVDLRQTDGPIISRRTIVTHSEAVGRTFASLQLQATCGVVATRLIRHGIEFVPTPKLRVQFGDMLMLVGTADALADAGKILGDSPKELEQTHVGPLFLGILLGVLVGLIPIALPGMPAPLRLGLAGGPLIVAIILGRIGSIGPIVWYVPPNAGLALREIGIVLFLACVGLKSGDLFFESLMNGQGFAWMGLGAAITFVPVFVTAFLARKVVGLSVSETGGLLAGSMTDPPALAYAQRTYDSSETSVAYATVYPLTMLLRVLSAQLLIFICV